jgi:N-acetylneuraminate synthase
VVCNQIMRPIYVVAEIGVNHNGNTDMAFQLIDAAIMAGANAVKLQTFKAESLVINNAVKAAYQMQTTDPEESQLAMLKRLELSRETHHELIAYCKEKEIGFLSTAFDVESLDFLVNDLGLRTLKISSGEITNAPLLFAYAQTGCDLILSTGMASLGEIEEALGVLAFGLMKGADTSLNPSRAAFQDAYLSSTGQQLLKKKVTVLHCTTEYPAPPEDINLNAMVTMRDTFGLKMGYSDHSDGIIVSIAAAVMGATLIEKHFTLDKSQLGPDHKASLEPEELTAMINAIRIVEKVMGSGVKGPMPSELKNRPIIRKSLIASQSIQAGEVFSEENLVVKRPGTGISPMEYWSILGTPARVAFETDQPLT